jgi:hypothetical protein
MADRVRLTEAEKKRCAPRSKPPAPNAKILKRSQAAAWLSVSTATTKRMEQAGVITPHRMKPDGGILIAVQELRKRAR